MEWPVLGKRRAAQAPEPRKKLRREPRHLIGKLDLVLSRANLPEQVEGIIERFVLGARHKTFLSKYGAQNARYIGPGFIPGWHPRVPSNTHDRWLWSLFAKVPNVEHFFRQTHGFRCDDMVDREPDPRQLKALEGKDVMIAYRNGQGRDMHLIKLVTYASDRALHVRDHADDPQSFTLKLERIQRLDLFVDLPRMAPKRRDTSAKNPRVNSAGQAWNCIRDGCRDFNCACRN